MKKVRLTPWWQNLFQTEQELVDEIATRLDNDESMNVIASAYGTNATNIYNMMKIHNLSRRKELRSKEWLESRYIKEHKTQQQIGDMLGVTYEAVSWYLNKFQILKRTLSEVQQLASATTRAESYKYLPTTNYQSRGYCARYDGQWFSSTAELTYYVSLKQHGFQFKFQPFTFDGKRPDFLVENQEVVEVKGGWDKTSDAHRQYIEWGKRMTDHYGYRYKIFDVCERMPVEYETVKGIILLQGGERGKTVNIERKIILHSLL